MNTKLKTEISLIRSFNRFYTDVLGLIDQHILKSKLFLSKVRASHEIEKTENCASEMLSDALYMDVGYLGHIVRKSERCSLIRREQSAIDGRVYDLYITDTGRERTIQLDNASSSQIAHLLRPLSETGCGFLVAHITAIETLLTEGRNVDPQNITTRAKVRPGDIGYIIYLYDYIYQEEYGYSIAFEHYVANSFVQSIG